MEIGSARVSTTRQDLERLIHALEQASIEGSRIDVDKRPGATIDRPGLRAALSYARERDVLMVRTLDWSGRTVRDTVNLIHDLAERGVGVNSLANPITVDPSNPSDPMAQLSVVLMVLFAQVQRTCERAAHARSVAVAVAMALVRRAGRPMLEDADEVACVVHLRAQGAVIAQIVARTGIARTSLYGHVPPRPTEPLAARAACPPTPVPPPAVITRWTP